MNIATFNRTALSLGLGRVERAILAIVDVEDEYEQSYAAEDLAIDIFRPEKPYLEDWWPTQAQHVAVIRAMNSLACADRRQGSFAALAKRPLPHIRGRRGRPFLKDSSLSLARVRCHLLRLPSAQLRYKLMSAW
jgi:hypothetical protein